MLFWGSRLGEVMSKGSVLVYDFWTPPPSYHFVHASHIQHIDQSMPVSLFCKNKKTFNLISHVRKEMFPNSPPRR